MIGYYTMLAVLYIVQDILLINYLLSYPCILRTGFTRYV